MSLNHPVLVTVFALLAVGKSATGQDVSFCRDVAPILLKRCVACHGPNAREGGYRVDTYELALGKGDSDIPGFVAHDLNDSEAFRRITSDDDSERMPVDADPIPDAERERLRRWIEEGATFDGANPAAPLGSLIPPPHYAAPPATYRAGPVAALQFAPDGQRLIAGGYHELTVWNSKDGKLIRRIANLPERTAAISMHPDGRKLATAGGQPGIRGELRIVDLVSGSVMETPLVATDMFLAVAFTPDGKRLAVGGTTSTIHLLDMGSKQPPITINSHSDWVTALAWNRDGSRLASAGRDTSAKVFDASSGRPIVSFAEHTTPVRGIAWIDEDRQICSLSDSGQIHLWHSKDGSKVANFSVGGRGLALQFSGQRLYACLNNGRIAEIDVANKKSQREYRHPHAWTLCLATSPNKNLLAGGTADGRIVLWDMTTQQIVHSFVAAPR
jgi:WD40 repeat protein